MKNQFILIPLIMSAVFLILQNFHIYKIESFNGVLKYRMKWLPAVLFSLPMIYFTWQRSYGFGDTYNYLIIYQNVPDSFSGLIEYLGTYPNDPAFSVLISLSKLAGFDYRTFLLIIAVFQILVLTAFYRRYSCDYFMSMFLFLISTDYYSWTWNGMRQFIAVCITLMAAPAIFNKNYIRSILIILAASLFHQSALIMIPVVFIVQGEPFNKRVLLVILLSMAALITVDLFTNFLDASLEGTNYSTIVSDYQNGPHLDDGTNPIRVIVYSVPAVIAWLGNKIIRFRNDKVIDVSANMAVMTSCIYLISMVTSGIFLGRIPIYFSLYSYLLLPWEIKNIFTERSKSLIILAMVILYICFYYYQMFITW